MTTTDPFDSALDLLRRLPPSEISVSLNHICALAPNLTEELLSSVDQPLEVKRCRKTGRDYLLCDYNRDGDSWRSPWSNEFEYHGQGNGANDEEEDGVKPSDRVRKMELAMSDGIEVYRDLYYEGGISSVYFWDLDDGFAGVILLKKNNPKATTCGSWDSIHVFEAIDRTRTCHYKLTSTVILGLTTANEVIGDLDLGGSMTRQLEQDLPVSNDMSHIINIGKLIEDMELKMRNLLQEVYFGKAKDIVGDLRSISQLTKTKEERASHREIIDAMKQ